MSSKIVSFRPMISGLDFAASDSILWPCNCFFVSIPYRGKNRLNVFEETILGLSGLGNGDTAELAAVSCLEKDLVSFIQNRLELLEFLDSRKEITGAGKKILDSQESEEESRFVSARVFMNLLNGKLLPYVHIGQLEYAINVDGGGDFLRFKIKATDERPIRASRIKFSSSDNSSYKKRVPTAPEIKRAIQAFRKRFERYAAFTGNAGVHPPRIPPDSSITISDMPEPVFLHCKAFIQKSNPDIIGVTDGFGFGYSDDFADYLMKNNWPGIKHLRDKADTESAGRQPEKNGDSTNRKPRIHRIAELINDARNVLKDADNIKVAGKSTEQQLYDYLSRALSKIYDVFERTLAKIVFDNPVSQWETIYAKQSFEDNNKILDGFVQKIGLTVEDRVRSILQVKKGAFHAMGPDTVDMQTALVLSITGAAQSGNHPFNQLAREYPDLLFTIFDFKGLRDPIQHGKIESRKLQEKARYYLEKTEKIVALLFPAIAEQFSGYTETERRCSDNDIENINQRRLKVIIELDSYFKSITVIHSLNPDLKELLIKISIAADDDDAANEAFNETVFHAGITNLASALQIMYHEVILSVNIFQIEDKSPADIKAIAFGRAVGTGFVSSVRDIPPVIANVSAEKLKRIVRGGTYSLQANFLVFLYLYENDILKTVYTNYPELLKLTAELAELRGHGNRNFYDAKGNYTREAFSQLKEKTFKAIKALMEVL